MTDEEIQSAIDDGAKRGDEELSALRQECARLETESSGLRNELRTALLRMEALEKRLEETASVAAEAAEAAANATATDVGGGAENVEPVMSGPDEQPPPTEDREPFAYQVMESDGKVYCFLPKKKEEDESEGSVTSSSDDDEGASEFCGGAYGGPHVGSSTDPIAEAGSPPHAKAGYKSSSGASGESSISDEPEQLDFSWAHYGWHEVGELDTSGSGVNDKIVVATFDVPIDPPEDQRSGVSVEGPSLSSIELMEIDDWKSACKDSWKAFDDPSGESVERKIPIALIANGIVTQLCVGVPFVERVSSPKEEVETPCPPTITGTISGSGVVITVQNYERSGDDCVPTTSGTTFIPFDELQIDCETIRGCISGSTETVVTDVFVSGDGNLYKKVRTAKALAWGDPSDVMIVSGTTCEDGEGSVTA